jgi:hypothetical protein
MKITKTQLRSIIKEELEAVMGEQVLLEELDNQIIEKYARAVAGGMRGSTALKDLGISVKGLSLLLADMITSKDPEYSAVYGKHGFDAGDSMPQEAIDELVEYLNNFDISSLFGGLMKSLGRKVGLNYVEQELTAAHDKVLEVFSKIQKRQAKGQSSKARPQRGPRPGDFESGMTTPMSLFGPKL